MFTTFVLAGSCLYGETATRSENAALQYYQAFLNAPKLKMADEEVLGDWKEARLDAQTRGLLKQYEASFKNLRRGAALEKCDWGLNFEEGPSLLLGHLQLARSLARASCLNIRVMFSENQQQAAGQDLVVVMRLARHVSSDGLLISVLVGIAIERMALETAAQHLWLMSPAQLHGLLDSMEKLQPHSTPADGIRMEKRVYLGWLRRTLADPAKAGKDLKLLGAEGITFALLTGGQKPAIDAMLKQTEKDYDRFIEAMEKPFPAAEQQLIEFEEGLKNANPISKLIMPAATSFHMQHGAQLSRVQMLVAAIHLFLDGEKACRKVMDPLSGKSFVLVDEKDGVTIRSQRLVRKRKVELLVHRPEL